MPGQAPEALTRSSAVTALSGVSGGASIETLRVNSRPGRENHSASLDSRSGVFAHAEISGAQASSVNSRVRFLCLSRTINQRPFFRSSSDRTAPLAQTRRKGQRALSNPNSNAAAPETWLGTDLLVPVLTDHLIVTLRHKRGCRDCPQERRTVIINRPGPLLPPLPAAVLVSLPVGHFETARLAVGPRRSRCSKRIIVIAIEDQHHPVVACANRPARRRCRSGTGPWPRSDCPRPPTSTIG